MNSAIRKSLRSALSGFVFIVAPVAVLNAAAIPAMAAERAVAPEKNPPGDIPDSQVFVAFKSPAGFVVKVPEGWARTERKDGARFANKFNSVDIRVAASATAPTIASVKANQAVDLVKNGRAVKVTAIRSVSLPAGPAVLVVYESNSEPNQVTNKQLRLENNRYLLFKNGKLATLDLAAPLGADNVDQWKVMADSFRWS